MITSNKLFNGQKGQVSLEMLLIITFLFVTLFPLIAYMYNIFAQDTWKVDVQQSQSVLGKLTEYADKLSLGGENAAAEVVLYFPSKVKNFTTVGKMIIISLDIPDLGMIDQVTAAKVPIVQLPTSGWGNMGGMQKIYLNYSGGTVYIYRLS